LERGSVSSSPACVAMAAPVPRLQLAGLTGDQRPVAPPDASAAGSGAEGQLALQTPGRASTRTRARAILRAKARARRREEAAKADTARAGTEVETVMEEDAVDDDEDMPLETCRQSGMEEQNCAIASVSSGPTRCTPGHSARIYSKGNIAEDASSSSSSDEDSCCFAEGIGATVHHGHFWEYPLSASEKQARLLMLFGRGEVLSEKQIRRGERRMERLRAQVRLMQESEKQLKRERRTLCDEAATLRNENKDLRRQVSDLQRRLAKRGSDTSCPRAPTKPQSSSAPDSSAAPANDVAPASAEEADPLMAAMETSRTKPATIVACASSDGASAAAAQTPPPPVLPTAAVAAAAAAATTPRVSGVTPRGHTARTPTGMRGTIASVTWAEAPDVPWLIFTNRVSGQWALYGDGRKVSLSEEEHTLSLRRGEFIQTVMGLHTERKGGRPQPLARSLKIVTSEQQEVLSGQAAHSSVGPSRTDHGYFCFEADLGHEIVGLCIQDGAISGVRQVHLAPSRVGLPGGSPSAWTARASFGAMPMSAACDSRATPLRPR